MNFGIGDELRRFFTEYLYPGLVIGIFLFLLFYNFTLVLRAHGESRIRRLTAAILPFLALIFSLLPGDGKSLAYLRIEGISIAGQFIVGVLVAVAILELGRWLSRVDAKIAAATYILFIAIVDTYTLYSMIENSLGNLHFILFGMVVGGGFYIIFRGVPLLSEKGVQNSGEVVGQGFEKISNARPSGRETQAALKSGAADLGLPSEARKKQAPRSALYDSFEDSNERAATRKVPQPPSPIPPPKDAR